MVGSLEHVVRATEAETSIAHGRNTMKIRWLSLESRALLLSDAAQSYIQVFIMLVGRLRVLIWEY